MLKRGKEKFQDKKAEEIKSTELELIVISRAAGYEKLGWLSVWSY